MSAQCLIAIATPPLATIQDAGRRGWMRWGVSGSGAMDIEALAAGNALVGNGWHEAAIEFAWIGGEWEIAARSCRLAVTGGNFRLTVDGIERPPYLSLDLRRGQRVRVEGAKDAVWGYIAVQGGFNVPELLGSRATLLRAKLGGVDGRMIAAGDALPLRAGDISHAPTRALPIPLKRSWQEVRVLLGPQDDHFPRTTLSNFAAEDWQVTNRIDRMGYHLSGPKLVHGEKGANIVSDGIAVGSIQVPASGQPIALMRDCQPTGGYPKLATILGCDLGRLAQIRPGSTLRFTPVSRVMAAHLHREFTNRLADLDRQARAARGVFVRRRGSIGELIGAMAG